MLKRLYRRWRCILLLVVLLHLTLSLLMAAFLQRDTSSTQFVYSLIQISKDPFGSRTAVSCPSVILTDSAEETKSSKALVPADNVCPWNPQKPGAEIKMEDILDKVSVGYPGLVLTVTGWVDTIQVDAWTVKPLTVIVMPHSHQDPGWLDTMEVYFASKTKKTLDLVVSQLTEHPDWTFIWSEVIFLQMWWEHASDDSKTKFKRLIASGQLEIVNGGLVMPDETVTHYAAVLDQWTEGHTWLKHTLNVTVENSWAIDPFGHSSTLAYLASEMGISNMVLQRVHFALKRHMATHKQLEFYWKQLSDSSSSHRGKRDVFCHVMPFLLYSIPHACGPDRHVCCKFDFHKKQCFQGNKQVDIVKVTDDNVPELATELWTQLQKKSELYCGGVVLLPHGDDFRYREKEEWTEQLGGLQKLMDHINNNQDMQMKMKFGTLKDYFRALHKDSSVSYPTLAGDLLPYSDRGDQYWSGIFTSRPQFKQLTRQLQHSLRSAELLYTLSLQSTNQLAASAMSRYTALQLSRKTLAVAQHHDAVTGTSRKTVMMDYKQKVQFAIGSMCEVQRESIESMLNNGKQGTISLSGCNSEKVLLKADQLPMRLVVWNSLGMVRHDVVSVRIDTRDVHVLNSSRQHVRFQISPVWTDQQDIDDQWFMLSFEVNLLPLSHAVYSVEYSEEALFHGTSVSFVNTIVNLARKKSVFDERYRSTEVVKVSNKVLTATFSACDGMLQHVKDQTSGGTYKVDAHYVTYSTGKNSHPFRDKSGAYIFLPDGVAKVLTERPSMTVIEGPLFVQVRTVYKDIIHTATLYKLSIVNAPLCRGIHVENTVNLGSSRWDNTELALRFETSISHNDLHFCTDSNGFQLHRRKTRAKMTLQGNFYPMTTMAMLEGHDQRFTLLSTYSHGVASLASGWLEVMLDRRLVQDDWRGLNEGVEDNVPTRSGFFILLEQLRQQNKIAQPNNYMCFSSVISSYMNNFLNNPPSVFTVNSNKEGQVTNPQTLKSNYPLNKPGRDLQPIKTASLPCGYHIVNMKMLEAQRTGEKQALLTLHREGLSCEVVLYGASACLNQAVFRFSYLPLNITRVVETSLTGLEDTTRLSVLGVINMEPMTIRTFKITFQ